MTSILDEAISMPTVHVGGIIDPTLFLVHGTASRITKFNCAKYCQKNSRKVAYHYIIETDGTLVNLAPINRRVNHAGRSKHKGREWCNGFSVSVGLVNPGPLNLLKRSYFHKEFDGAVKMASPFHKEAYWLPFTPAQKATLDKLYRAVCDVLEKKLEVAGHFQVSPGRKSDPNPTLDLSALGAAKLEEVPHQPPPPPTKNVLGQQSREYKAADIVKVGLGGTAVARAGIEVANTFSVENITTTKTYLDTINGFVEAYGTGMLIGGCLAGYLLVEAIQYWKRQSYDDGRYEPSGAQEQEPAT